MMSTFIEEELMANNSLINNDQKMIVTDEFFSVDTIYIKEEPVEVENTDEFNEDLHNELKVCSYITYLLV